MDKIDISHGQLSLVSRESAEPGMSNRDTVFIVKVGGYSPEITLRAIRCDDRDHKRLGEVMLQSLTRGDEEIYADDIDLDTDFDRDQITEVLQEYLEDL